MLLLSDRVDEWVVAHLTEFEGKPLQSVAKGELDLGKLADEEEKKEQEKEAGEYKELVEQDRGSARRARQGGARHAPADASPACLVADEHGMSANLERMLKAAGQKVPAVEADPGDQLRIIRWCSS